VREARVSCMPCRRDLNHPPTTVGGIRSSQLTARDQVSKIIAPERALGADSPVAGFSSSCVGEVDNDEVKHILVE